MFNLKQLTEEITMDRIRIKLTNEFHGTECFVMVRKNGELSHKQVLNARRKLCGMIRCTCGDIAGCRPTQVEQISQEFHEADNRYRLLSYRYVTNILTGKKGA
jgi:hypothetical protein